MQMSMLSQQSQADAAMQKEPPEKPKKRPEDPAKAKEMDRNEEHEAAMDEHNEQQAQAQAQAMAVDRFITANPELFKSFQENLAKAEAEREANAEHVERLRDGLVADFERGANFLMKDIMEALKEDVGQRDDDKEKK
jgi:Na+/phosphate symporter